MIYDREALDCLVEGFVASYASYAFDSMVAWSHDLSTWRIQWEEFLAEEAAVPALSSKIAYQKIQHKERELSKLVSQYNRRIGMGFSHKNWRKKYAGNLLKTETFLCKIEPEDLKAMVPQSQWQKVQLYQFKKLYLTKTEDYKEYEKGHSRRIPLQTLIVEDLLFSLENILVGCWAEFEKGLLHTVQEAGDALWNRVVKEDYETAIWTKSLAFDAELFFKSFETQVELEKKRIQDLLLILDTPLFPLKRYHKELNKKNLQNIRSRSRLGKRWRSLWSVVFSEWEMEVDLVQWWIAFQEGNQNQKRRFGKQVCDATSNRIRDLLNDLDQDDAKMIDLKGSSNWRRFLNTEKKTWQDKWVNASLDQLVDHLSEYNPAVVLSKYAQSQLTKITELKPEYQFIEILKLDRSRPYFDSNQLPIQKILFRDFSLVFKQKITTESMRITERYLELVNGWNQLGQVVISAFEATTFNLRKLATQDKVDIDERVKETFVEGKGRVRQKIQELEKWQTEIEKDLSKVIENCEISVLKELELLGDREKLLSIKLSMHKGNLLDRVLNRVQYLNKMAKSLNANFELIISKPMLRLYGYYKEKVKEIIEASRLRSTQGTTPLETSLFLKKSEEKIDQLPAIYQRLFRFTATRDERYFFAREKEIEKVISLFTHWERGGQGLIVLTGERGMGKSSIIDYVVENKMSDYRTYRIQAEKSLLSLEELRLFLVTAFKESKDLSLSELEEKIENSDRLEIVILEDLHHLFIKSIRGLEVFQRLLLFLTKTQNKIFWLVSCSRYTWGYLNPVLGLQKFFSEQVELHSFSNVEIEKLILSRHLLSGINLEYVATPEQLRNRKYRFLQDPREKQNWLKNEVFNKIAVASGGNVSVAFLLWLTNLKYDNQFGMRICEIDDFDEAILFELDEEELFVLVAIIQQVHITDSMLAEIFNLNIEQSTLILKNLENRGWLLKRGDCYQLHFFLFKPLVNRLFEKRMLYK